jgi:tetratricopeptide (TPR) repeat protein
VGGEAHRGLGQAYEGLGQVDRAMESYRSALAADPHDVVALNNLAWLFAEVRRSPEQALPLALQANRIAPRSPEVMDTLGWVHYRRGAYAEAEKLLADAVRLAADNAAIHYHLGMTYHKRGKKTDALYTLRRAAQLDPKLAETENLAPIIRELGG